jgi:predicted SAM-dependent methyltransferase
MRSQKFKDFVFTATGPATALNRELWRIRLAGGLPESLRRRDALWLNIGSGAHPMPGFVNVDVNLAQKPDMWLDIRQGLPFADDSVDRIYTRHVLEHFYAEELTHVLAECRRVLKPGAGMRILVPSFEVACRAYLANDPAGLSAFPRPYRSLGGQFVNLVFCDGQHRIGFDFSFMQELLAGAGFSQVHKRERGQGTLFPPEALADAAPAEGWIENSLSVEAMK